MSTTKNKKLLKERTLEWMNAWKDQNTQQLNNLLADCFSMVSMQRKKMYLDKEEWLKMAASYNIEKYKIDFLQVINCNLTGIVIYKLTMHARPNYTGEAEQFVVTDAWSFSKEQWMAVCRQSTPL